MTTFLIRSATSQLNSYLIVLTKLCVHRPRPNAILKLLKCRESIEPSTYWLVIRHADPYTNDNNNNNNNNNKDNDNNDVITFRKHQQLWQCLSNCTTNGHSINAFIKFLWWDTRVNWKIWSISYKKWGGTKITWIQEQSRYHPHSHTGWERAIRILCYAPRVTFL